MDGYYVDAKKGSCQSCSENKNCKSCYQLSLKSIHRTDYFDYVYDGDE